MKCCLCKIRKSNKPYYLLIVLFAFLHLHSSHVYAQKLVKDKFEKKSLVGKQKDESYIVPTFQIIDPAGTTIAFPGRPVDL